MKRTITFLIVLISFLSTSYGQGGSVKGVVKDSNGEALIGVAIQLEGSLSGVVTDYDGNYEIGNVPADGVLNFSYIGMTSVSEAINNRTIINVTMETDAKKLDEVVVIGYGTTTRRKATGALSSIGSEKIANTTYPDIQTALQGQVPGLIVESAGGGVNNTPSISIRGGGTPLFVIDGIISAEETFTMLNSNDIESMTFLKDASATAVYGSQAANGVVLVTTKRGKSGAPTVTYSGQFTVAQPTVVPDMINSQTYMENVNYIDGLTGKAQPTYSDDMIQSVGKDYRYPSNNWYDLIFKDFSFQQKHNVSVSGGGDQSSYFISTGYLTDNGMLDTPQDESLERFNVRANLVSEFGETGLKMTAGLAATAQESNTPDYANYSAIYETSPLIWAYNPDGTLANDGGTNPLEFFNGEGYNNQQRRNFNTQVNLDWAVPFVDGLSLGTMGAYTIRDHFQRNWTAYPTRYSWDQVAEVSSPANVRNSPEMEVTSKYFRSIDFEARIAYNRTFGKHTIDALALYTQRRFNSDFVEGRRIDYSTTALDQLTAGPTLGMTNDGYQSESANAGLVFRLKYDFMSKYILEFSGRYDGNANFAPGYRWGFFPAVSGVWIMSDENFMKSLRDRNIINLLKVRASYGQTGLSDSGYGYISGYETSKKFTYVDGAYTTGLDEGSLTDPSSYTWYTSESTNIGFDVSALNNKIEASLDYFYYETTGYLMSPGAEYTTILGTKLPEVVSDTELRRAGWEIALRYRNTFGKWKVEVGGNASYYNQLYAWDDSESIDQLKNPYQRRTQQRDFFDTMYHATGYYQTTDDILTTPRALKYTQTMCGELAYEDVNGDGQITAEDQRRTDGTFEPHLNYGVDFRVGWNNFTLSGLFQGTGTRMTYLTNAKQADPANSLLEYMQDTWSEDNRDARFPVMSGTGGGYTLYSDWYLENALYFRLKNLSLSYDFKSKLLKDVNCIKGLTVSLSGTNLFTISDVSGFMDPEAVLWNPNGSTTVNNAATSGGVPMQRTYTLGVSVKF